MSNKKSEQIKLTLPVNAAYVSAARLTTSSIANRLGFEIDEIEDIKTAVSEACTYVIKKHNSSETNDSFKICFDFLDNILNISISLKNFSEKESENEEMSLLVIKALMNTLEIKTSEEGLNIQMSKRHVSTFFGV